MSQITSAAGVRQKSSVEKNLNTDLLFNLEEFNDRAKWEEREPTLDKIKTNWGETAYENFIESMPNILTTPSTSQQIMKALRSARIIPSDRLIQFEMKKVDLAQNVEAHDILKQEYLHNKSSFKSKMLSDDVGLSAVDKCKGCMRKATQMYGQSLGSLRLATEKLYQFISTGSVDEQLKKEIRTNFNSGIKKQQPWSSLTNRTQWSETKTSALGYFWLAYQYFLECLYIPPPASIRENSIMIPNIERAEMNRKLYLMVGPHIQNTHTSGRAVRGRTRPLQNKLMIGGTDLVELSQSTSQLLRYFKTQNEILNNGETTVVKGWLGFRWEKFGFPGGFQEAMPFMSYREALKLLDDVNNFVTDSEIVFETCITAETERIMKYTPQQLYEMDEFEDISYERARLPYSVAFEEALQLVPPNVNTVMNPTPKVLRFKNVRVTLNLNMDPVQSAWFAPCELAGNAFQPTTRREVLNAFVVETPYSSPYSGKLYAGFRDARCALAQAMAVSAHYALNEDSSSPNVPSLAGMRTSTPLSLGQYVVQNENVGLVRDSWPAMLLNIQDGDKVHNAVNRLIENAGIDLFRNTSFTEQTSYIEWDHGKLAMHREFIDNYTQLSTTEQANAMAEATEQLMNENQNTFNAYMPSLMDIPEDVPYGMVVKLGNRLHNIRVYRYGEVVMLNEAFSRTGVQVGAHALETAFLESAYAPQPPSGQPHSSGDPAAWAQFIVHGNGPAAPAMREHMWKYAVDGTTGNERINAVMHLIPTDSLHTFVHATPRLDSPYRVLVHMFLSRVSA